MRRRLTIRARLTLTYTAMIAASTGILLVLVYVFLRFVPSYEIVGAPVIPREAQTTSSLSRESSTIAIRSANDFLNTFLIVSALVLVVVVAGGAVVSWVVAGRVLRPLSLISEAARIASGGTLDHRINFTGPVDEIHELADAFDTMLARLDGAFQAQRRFAANASHELRTPLSTTQTMLEVSRRHKETSRAELLRLVERVDEVNRRNIETVEALLDLAEIEQTTIGREPVRLDRLAQQNVELVEAERAESDIEVITRLDPVTTTGDPVLIRQAIANLAFNAVRHNVDGGRIEITTGSEDNGAFIRISNTGSVLSSEQVAALTEPFVRGAGRISSRGHGLGLAIVQSVADAHGGTLLLEPRAGGGLTVTLVLPPH